MTSRRRLPLILLALICAGCGSSAPSGMGTGTTRSDTKSASAQEKAVKFSECMRGSGVPDFPDPNAKGDFDYGVSVTPAVFQKAIHACKALQPSGSLSSKRTPKEQSAGLRFAACVRRNGVRDFPDPVNGEPVINTYKIPSSNEPGGMDILDAAVAKCREDLHGAVSGK